MVPRTSSIAFALLLTLAGCDAGTNTELADDELRGLLDACVEIDITGQLTSYDPLTNRYADPTLWLSGPDAIDDFVLSVNLDTTIVYPDLSTDVIHPKRASNPDLDIFFIHPTVNFSTVAGNDDLSDLTNTKAFTAESAARFSTIGRVVAPLYRSATTGCFLEGGQVLDDCLEFAYQDVEDAFEYYLANQWGGQKLVIMGWSQGAIMTRMLVQRLLAKNSLLMSRVAVVMPMSGDLELDSFSTIPECTSEDHTGCYIAYHAFLNGAGPQPGTVIGDWADSHAACTDVVGAAAQSGVFTMSYFQVPTQPGLLPTDALTPIPITIDTPYMAFPEYYGGECVNNGGRYLEVVQADPSNDQRWTPIDYSHPFVVPDPPFGLGLHIFDYSLGMGDLLYLVEKKADKLAQKYSICVVK